MPETKQLEDALFFTALHLTEPEERRRFLNQTCAANEAMRRNIERLLAAAEGADSLLDLGYQAIAHSGPVVRELAADVSRVEGQPPGERIGSKIGPYTLMESLGRGGCGEVYLAEQEKPVRREVALKVIKLGMDTRSVIARFEAERQALAMMDHPNIARVLDAGATAQGRPYFVLELVRGTPITEFCNSGKLDLHQRIGLVIQVCRAIQHAHQKGIIHRDIKPTNILVTTQDGAPVPKVIDFGVAKAIEGRLTEETIDTQFEQVLGTPAYMSPEQAGVGSADIDTRTDIYSLGALLYELVTGHPPFERAQFPNVPQVELPRAFASHEPLRPSTLLRQMSPQEFAALGRSLSMEPARVLAMVRGDLDWIIMRAMEKDRARRYESASGLAVDLERFLNHEPVVARPPGRLYVLRKLARRNRILFSAAAVVLLALLAGLGASTWLYLRASRAERRQAELRHTAEGALATEAWLRRQAETREKLTEAVVLIRKEDYEAAAAVLSQLDVQPNKPSLDAVTALRDVGLWLGGQQRWSEASKCFLWLFEIDILDRWQTVTIDFQACGALLADSGDEEGYSRFRTTLASTHGQVADGDEGGRILKSCLLLPIDPQLRESLSPLAGTVSDWYMAFPAESRNPWASLPLCLWRYRIGDFAGSAALAEAALPGTNDSMAHRPAHEAILAMVSHKQGDPSVALAHLHSARQAVERKFADTLAEGAGGSGYWYDWLFARVLVREASEMIEGR